MHVRKVIDALYYCITVCVNAVLDSTEVSDESVGAKGTELPGAINSEEPLGAKGTELLPEGATVINSDGLCLPRWVYFMQ